MRPKYITLTLATPDPNGISVSQKPLAAGNLTITGVLATGGVATMDVPRHIVIESDADDSPNTFVVTGTDRNGNVITETTIGPNATQKNLTKNFATVTQISIDNPAVGNLIVGTNDEADTQPVPCDQYVHDVRYQGSISSGGSLEYAVQYTLDNPWADGFEEGTATWLDDASGKVAAYSNKIDGGIRAIRAAVSVFSSGTLTLAITHTGS